MPKLEQIKFLCFKTLFNIAFYRNLMIKIQNSFFLKFFFLWKITSYADNFWFIYNNKKTLHELRYLNK